MDNVIKLADELGKKLADQPATQIFLKRQKALAGDKDAQELLDHFQEQAQKIAGLEAQGTPIEPADKQELSRLQGQLSASPTVKDFMTAQVAYMDMMRKINQAIMNQLAPAEENSES